MAKTDSPPAPVAKVGLFPRLLFATWRVLSRSTRLQYFLLHRLNPRFVVGACAVILDDENRLLLFHHPYRRIHPWGFPGGWLRKGDSPEMTLVREVAEESALAVEVVGPLTVDVRGDHATVEMIYLAKFVGGRFLPSAEVTEMRWLSADDEIPDAMTPLQRSVAARVLELATSGRLPSRLNV